MIAGHSVRDGLTMAAAALGRAGIPSSRLDARLLVGHTLGLSPEAMLAHPDRPVTQADHERLEAVVARRARREPIAHILGTREFWSLPFRVTAATLVPRPDSETVVETALARLRDRPSRIRILDLGTGSGCLLLALLSELPRATGIGVDLSPAALRVAAGNARALGFADRAAFLCGSWVEALSGAFDVIVANPPYVAADEVGGLDPEVATYEPRLALAGGPDGLDSYRMILPQLSDHLAPDGFAALEIGAGQSESLATLAARHHLQVAELRKDLTDCPRCLVLLPLRVRP